MSSGDVELVDLGFYRHIQCCILDAAKTVLVSNGLPVPERSDIVYSGVLGDPNCCDALLVTIGDTTVNPKWQATGCLGPQQMFVDFEVRIFRDNCPAHPVAEACTKHVDGDCGNWVPCPGEPLLIPDDPCERQERSWQETLIAADRYALETSLADAVKGCLCEPRCEGQPCPWSCDRVLFMKSKKATGACGGTIITLRVEVTGQQ